MLSADVVQAVPFLHSGACPCFLLVSALMLVLTLNKREWGLILVKANSLSETLQADQLCKKAGHTGASVSLRNRDENLLFFDDNLNFCGIKQAIK